MLGDSRHGAVCKLRRQVSLLRTGGIPEGGVWRHGSGRWSLWKRPRGGDPDAMHALAVQAGRLRTRAAAQTDGVGKSGIAFSWKRWG
jgi:hypothetical protein